MPHKRFNIRVYGLLIVNDSILVSHEAIGDGLYVKFPGGGLEFGEGTKDALIREFIEELDLPVQVLDHFYTTDFYLPSAFSQDDQVISIYYSVAADNAAQIAIGSALPQQDEVRAAGQICRWHPLAELTEDLFTLAADKVVVRMMMERPFQDGYLRNPDVGLSKS